ncbi:MAG: 2-iminoacetate synthase ThiH, partial [Porphyromonadaceae bacterium]|nr:2-iminoacetate synthase ThiH [Porphyromonadaceae bacterium]
MTTGTTAYDVLRAYDFDTLQREIYSKTAADVQRALAAPHRTIADFMALVSP